MDRIGLRTYMNGSVMSYIWAQVVHEELKKEHKMISPEREPISFIELSLDHRANNRLQDLGFEIFERNRIDDIGNAQTELKRRTKQLPTQVLILGCGGIGAWVAKFISGIPYVKRLILVDPDVVETSNINRTPFTLLDVGALKVSALAKMIHTTNPTCNIVPLNRYFNEEFANEFGVNSESYMTNSSHPIMLNDDTMVIDCRDDYFNDYENLDKIFINSTWLIRAAYNGSSITIDYNPADHPVMGRAGYTVTPSHIIPSSMAGLLVVIAAINYSTYVDGEKDYSYILRNPITFNVEDILEHIFKGLLLEKFAASGDNSAAKVLDDIQCEKFQMIVEKNLANKNEDDIVELV